MRVALGGFDAVETGVGQVSGAVVLHHQSRPATRDVRDNGGAAMQLGDGAETDGECEVDGLALAQSHVAGFDEHARGAQVARAAETMVTARQEHVHGSARTMARCQSSLHDSALLFLFDAMGCCSAIMHTVRRV